MKERVTNQKVGHCTDLLRYLDLRQRRGKDRPNEDNGKDSEKGSHEGC